MIHADDPVTLLLHGRPRRPIVCSLCGELLGAWFQYQTTFYPSFRPCTDECERLITFAQGGRSVPREWREYPQEWRAPLLASALVQREALHAK